MTSKDITVTDGRLAKAFKNMVEATSDNTTAIKLKSEVDKSKIHLGEMVMFYPYLDKAKVTLKDENKTIICKILHKCWGDMLDFFTPQGDWSFDNSLKERCILPTAPIPCLIADINDNSEEWLMLGYYADYDIVHNKPADKGEYKLTYIGATDEFYLKFGNGKFEVATTSGISITEKNVGESERVEYYTKSEVDELLDKLKEELSEDNNAAG